MNLKKVQFKDEESLKKQLDKEQNFHLQFTICKKNNKYLRSIVEQCIVNNNFYGISFQIDKEFYSFNNLFYLNELIVKLLSAGKRIGLWGIPECAIRMLLGGYVYMRFIQNRIPEEYIFDNTKIKVFLLECENCCERALCLGVGSKNKDGFKPHYISNKIVQERKTKHKVFEMTSAHLCSKYEEFIRYCTSKDNYITNRRLYFATNIDFGSEHSYDARFIFMCDFLMQKDYKKEFDFLRKQCINTTYVDYIDSMACIEKISQIAYSIAEKNNVLRESFYIYSPESYGSNLLKDFEINYCIPKSNDMKFIGVGIDVIEEEIVSYKLYFRSSSSFLASYLEPFDLDILRVNAKLHYMVLRLDKDQNYLAYKIEILITHQDFIFFKKLIDNYEYFDANFEELGIYNIAIEIERENITKINIYHRNYLNEKRPYAI